MTLKVSLYILAVAVELAGISYGLWDLRKREARYERAREANNEPVPLHDSQGNIQPQRPPIRRGELAYEDSYGTPIESNIVQIRALIALLFGSVIGFIANLM